MQFIIQVPNNGFDPNLKNGLIAGGKRRKEGRQPCYFSAVHPQGRKAVPGRKGWEPQLVPCDHHKCHTDTIYEIDLVRAQEMGLTNLSNIQVCCCSIFGDIPAEYIPRFVGHDQTLLCERPSEVTPNDPAIQAHFRASGDRLLHQDQQQRRLDLIRSCVKIILQSPNKYELTRNQFSMKNKGAAADERTAEL